MLAITAIARNAEKLVQTTVPLLKKTNAHHNAVPKRLDIIYYFAQKVSI